MFFCLVWGQKILKWCKRGSVLVTIQHDHHLSPECNLVLQSNMLRGSGFECQPHLSSLTFMLIREGRGSLASPPQTHFPSSTGFLGSSLHWNGHFLIMSCLLILILSSLSLSIQWKQAQEWRDLCGQPHLTHRRHHLGQWWLLCNGKAHDEQHSSQTQCYLPQHWMTAVNHWVSVKLESYWCATYYHNTKYFRSKLSNFLTENLPKNVEFK